MSADRELRDQDALKPLVLSTSIQGISASTSERLMNFWDALTDDRQVSGLPTLDEVLKAFFDVAVADLAGLAGGVLWLIVIALSLKTIDRRDNMAGASYVLFMTGAGVAMVIAIPARLKHAYDLSLRHLMITSALATIAAARWVIRPGPPTRIVPTSLADEEGDKA